MDEADNWLILLLKSTGADITSTGLTILIMIPEPDADPDNEDYAGLDANDLLEIIRELPPKYRIVFNLYAIEGYSHKEISKMVNISEGTSKSNLSRARVILQRRVGSYTGLKKKAVNE